MTVKMRIALALAAIVLMPLTPALAADYDPPIYVDQAPDYRAGRSRLGMVSARRRRLRVQPSVRARRKR